MASKRPTVWTVLHDGDIVCDNNGAIPCFASREGVEHFMSNIGMEVPEFEVKELSLSEPELAPSSPFRIN